MFFTLKDEDEKTSRFGRWVRRSAGVTSMAAVPIVGGCVYLENHVRAIEQGPPDNVMAMEPGDHFTASPVNNAQLAMKYNPIVQKAADGACAKIGKKGNWTKFVNIRLRELDEDRGYNVAINCRSAQKAAKHYESEEPSDKADKILRSR